MEHTVMGIILETLRKVYGEDFVALADGRIYVTDEEANGACEVSIRYME